jgi:hypothetical protein
MRCKYFFGVGFLGTFSTLIPYTGRVLYQCRPISWSLGSTRRKYHAVFRLHPSRGQQFGQLYLRTEHSGEFQRCILSSLRPGQFLVDRGGNGIGNEELPDVRYVLQCSGERYVTS